MPSSAPSTTLRRLDESQHVRHDRHTSCEPDLRRGDRIDPLSAPPTSAKTWSACCTTSCSNRPHASAGSPTSCSTTPGSTPAAAPGRKRFHAKDRLDSVLSRMACGRDSTCGSPSIPTSSSSSTRSRSTASSRTCSTTRSTTGSPGRGPRRGSAPLRVLVEDRARRRAGLCSAPLRALPRSGARPPGGYDPRAPASGLRSPSSSPAAGRQPRLRGPRPARRAVHVRASSDGTAAGSSMTNDEPRPFGASTQIRPSMRRTSSRQMYSPRPVPPTPRVSSGRAGRTSRRSAPALPAECRFPRR